MSYETRLASVPDGIRIITTQESEIVSSRFCLDINQAEQEIRRELWRTEARRRVFKIGSGILAGAITSSTVGSLLDHEYWLALNSSLGFWSLYYFYTKFKEQLTSGEILSSQIQKIGVLKRLSRIEPNS